MVFYIKKNDITSIITTHSNINNFDLTIKFNNFTYNNYKTFYYQFNS